MSRLVILIYLLQIGLDVMSFDYCKKNLCPSGVQHIACENSGYISNNCRRNADIEVIDKNLKKLILRKHNEYRNDVANGGCDFGIAGRMRTLIWNKELSYLAELNVKQCTENKSECVATTLFGNPGQNLALAKYSGERTLEDVVAEQINEWIKKNETEHNKQIIVDQADEVGCAILREKYTCTTYQYLTCIYNKAVKDNDRLYLQGNTPGEKCVSGPNECYSSLCSPNEK